MDEEEEMQHRSEGGGGYRMECERASWVAECELCSRRGRKGRCGEGAAVMAWVWWAWWEHRRRTSRQCSLTARDLSVFLDGCRYRWPCDVATCAEPNGCHVKQVLVAASAGIEITGGDEVAISEVVRRAGVAERWRAVSRCGQLAGQEVHATKGRCAHLNFSRSGSCARKLMSFRW